MYNYALLQVSNAKAEEIQKQICDVFKCAHTHTHTHTHAHTLQQLPGLAPSMSPSLPVPPHVDFSTGSSNGGSLPFSSTGLSPSPTQGHAHFGLPPPSKKFKGRTNKNKDPIIIRNMQDSWVVPGIAAGGQQVPSFSQFSPTNLHSVPQPSPIPGFTSPMLGMRNENANLLGSDMEGRNGIGMGFPPPVEDSPKSSDFDTGHSLPGGRGATSTVQRLRSLSSSGASMTGSIQDISLSGSHSSIPVVGSGQSGSNGNILGGEPFQSHLNDTIDSCPFVASSSAPSMPPPSSSTLPMLPLKATPTTGSSGHLPLLNNNVAATSLIAKPPSILNDHHDLHNHTHHHPSSSAPSSLSISAGSPDPSLLQVASASVHHVETLPNSSYNNTALPDGYMQPHPFLSHPPSGVGGALAAGQQPAVGGGNFSHNIMMGLSPQQQHAHDSFPHLAVPNAGSHTLPFAAPYPQPNHHHQPLPGDSFSSKTSSVPPHPPLHVVAPAIHVDNELAQVDEYMQQYLSENHNHETLRNGAIMNATKEHDGLISQVLLMSPKHQGGFDQRRSSGTTTAMFLSTLEETRKNGRGSPFSPRSAEALRMLASRRGSLDELMSATTTGVDSNVGVRSPLQRRTNPTTPNLDNVGLRSPLQRRTSSVTPSDDNIGVHSPLQRRTSSATLSGDNVGLRSPLQRRTSTASDKVGPYSPLERRTSLTSGHNSSTTTPSSEANTLLTSSHSQDIIVHHSHGHAHISEANSDTSSGVSSAGTKFSSSTACSSGQSSPIGSTNSPAVLLSPLATPSPTDSYIKDSFSYPPSVSSRDRRASQNSNSGLGDLLDQIYEPYPALSNNEGEYMIENPDLRPPRPPKIKGEIDLHPKVPIFEVREFVLSGLSKCICALAYCSVRMLLCIPCLWDIS